MPLVDLPPRRKAISFRHSKNRPADLTPYSSLELPQLRPRPPRSLQRRKELTIVDPLQLKQSLPLPAQRQDPLPLLDYMSRWEQLVGEQSAKQLAQVKFGGEASWRRQAQALLQLHAREVASLRGRMRLCSEFDDQYFSISRILNL